MKLLTMYLPQFHRTAENDAWWGDGFTEWSAVKQAKPLFEGHKQPKCPLNGDYYDLLDCNTMKKQAEIMQEYGIDGQCFYHYYFKDGKKILERPAENLLKCKDINMSFCFSWANEAWIRSWSKLLGRQGNNAWFEIFDRSNETGNVSDVLIEQDYGDEDDWTEHFYYLLPFFKDDRYIKYEGHPVFMFYKPELIPCLDEMMKHWDYLAKENNIESIYFIGSPQIKSDRFNNTYRREPATAVATMNNRKIIKPPFQECFNYIDVWNEIIYEPHEIGDIVSGFVNYDDSPRRGANGMLIADSSPELFAIYMEKLFEKAEALEAPFVFLNAWNEWGEGNYLEPDDYYGYSYLEAIKDARKVAAKKKDYSAEEYMDYKGECLHLNEQKERYKGYWRLLDKWMDIAESGRSVAKYLKMHGHNKIAIYGNGMLGKHLIKDCEKNGVDIQFIIDSKKTSYSSYTIYKLDEDIPAVGMVVIAVSYDLETIEEVVTQKVNFNEIVRLGDIIEKAGRADE